MAYISIIGSGVVGLATGNGFLHHGHSVEFRDTNEDVLDSLRHKGYETAHLDEPFARNPDFFLICVPTPNNADSTDLSALIRAVTAVGNALKVQDQFSIVVIRSTVPIGTTHEVCTPLLEKITGKKSGIDFGIVVNPEYLREDQAASDFLNPRLVVLGSEDKRSTQSLSDIYAPLSNNIAVLSTTEAEMHKYIHNLFNACKISFFNEQRAICNALEVDADVLFSLVVKSAEGSWNPSYGTRNRGPFSGSCLPKDLDSFISWARHRLGLRLPLLEAVKTVNDTMKI